MNDVTPRPPAQRPLLWPEFVLDLQDYFAGSQTPVYIVGGAVRDALLHHPLHDIDLTTPGDSIKIGRSIANAFDGNFYVMDAEREVARALVDRPEGRYIVDIARFRGDSLLSDLTDRDFTFNAMAADLTADISLLIDPLGGEHDLQTHVLRQCSDHAISDDPLRGLRAVRLSVALSTRIEPETLRDIREHAPSLADTSAERVRDEFFKLLALRKPAAALRVAASLGLIVPMLPEVHALREQTRDLPSGQNNAWDYTLLVVEKMAGLLATISPRRTDLTAAVFDLGMIVMSMDVFRSQLQEHIAQRWPNDRSHEALLILAALLHDTGVDPHKIVDDLRLSTDERKRIQTMLRGYDAVYDLETDDLSLHRFWRQDGAAGIDQCLVALAVYLGARGSALIQDEWVALVEHIQVILSAYFVRFNSVVEPPALLSGDDLLTALNLKPGKQIGDLLTLIREAQVTGDVVTMEDAITLARSTLT